MTVADKLWLGALLYFVLTLLTFFLMAWIAPGKEIREFQAQCARSKQELAEVLRPALDWLDQQITKVTGGKFR